MTINKKKILIALFSLLAIFLVARNFIINKDFNNTSDQKLADTPYKEGRFSLSYFSESETDFASLMPLGGSTNNKVNDNHYKISLEGEWEWKHLEQKRWAMKLLIKQFVTSNLQTINKEELEYPFIVSFDNDGRPEGFQFDSHLTEFSKMILKNLLALSQFVYQSNAIPKLNLNDNRNWRIHEFDSNGKYFAQYTVGKQDNGLTEVIRQQKKYIERQSSRPGVKNQLDFQKIVETEGQTAFYLNSQQTTLEKIMLDEKQHVRLEDKTLANVHQTLSLTFIDKLNTNSSLVGSKGVSDQTQLFEPSYNEKNFDPIKFEKKISEQELGSIDKKDLYKEFLAAARSKNKDQIDAFYLKFKALLYLYPDTAFEISKMIQSLEDKSWGQITLLRALGSVGNEQCQTALGQLIDDAKNETIQSRITLELANVKNPNESSEKLLRELIQKTNSPLVTSTAGLSLGMMAFHLSDSNEQREQRIVDDFIDEYKNSSNDKEKNYLVSALGNSGSKFADEQLTSIAEDKNVSSELRAESVRSMRLLAGDEATDKISSYTKNSDKKVQEAAVFALSFRQQTEQSVNDQKALFGTTKDILLKRAILQNLVEAQSVDPNIKYWMQSQKTQEKDPELVKYIDNLCRKN